MWNSIKTSTALLLALTLSAANAWAGDLENTLDALSSMAPEKAKAQLEASFESDAEGDALVLGAPLRARFSADQAGYLTVLRLDSHGVATLDLPRDSDEARLEAGDPLVRSIGEVSAPTGPSYLFGLLTERPILRQELGYFASGDGPSVIDAGDAPALVEALRRAADSSGLLSTALSENLIEGDLDSETIVAYFTSPVTRSLRRPSLDIYINFKFDSAEIKDESLPMVETLADALRDDSMSGTSFVLGGHADDVGTEEYNLDLSRRRAESVRNYLVTKGVEDSRFAIEAYGETRPLQEGEDEDTRALNRRVELILRR